MISVLKRKCIVAIWFLLISAADTQMAMFPMFVPPPPPPPPPQPVPVPVPVPVAMPVPVPMLYREPTKMTTTTTTTEQIPIILRVPVPMPVPMPMPVQPLLPPAYPPIVCQGNGPNRPKSCPPCPHCIIPGPPPVMAPPLGIPVPYPPMYVPRPVVVAPFLPPRPRRPPVHVCSSESSESYSYTDTDSYSDTDTDTDYDTSSSYTWRNKQILRKKRRKQTKQGKRKLRYGRKNIKHIKRIPSRLTRRQYKSIEMSEDELVKPVFSYISKKGDVKFRKTLTNDEADDLIDDNKNIQLTAGHDNDGKTSILIKSNKATNNKGATNLRSNHRNKKVVLSQGTARHMLGEGKKELWFRPPAGKQISNLSVSFKIS